TIDVLVERIDPVGRPELGPALEAAASGRFAAVARMIDPLPGRLDPPGTGGGAITLSAGADGGGPADPHSLAYAGTLGEGGRDRAAVAGVRAMVEAGRTGTLTVGTGESDCDQPLTLFVECCAPPPRMLVYGAVDFAAALVRLGTYLGYEVTVCDARPVFATAERFPDAAHVVVDWPHRHLEATRTDHRTVVCVLTHDAKFDVPLLERALRMPLAYVGAMGSRRAHHDRLRRLRGAGLAEDELAGLHSPVGLDLGGRTPEETALSIAAEIVAVRRGGTGLPLTHRDGPVHRPAGLVPVPAT
ncbi:XdhC family protein, partial [Streptomyces griseoruber]|uniref:XdhC family protein n=1 Tax=Streptomyces griseoruber TaxID=1943 RepID=UPI000AB0CA20